MNAIIKPARLRKGDLIGVVAPASAPVSLDRIEKGVRFLERSGFRVKLGKFVDKSDGYLAGSDEERALDFNQMFEDREIKTIFSLRGGYGSLRILDRINYSLIRNNPKIFTGYSDLTALQCALFKKSGLISFAGPMVAVEMADGLDPFTKNCFWKILTSSEEKTILFNPPDQPIKVLKEGICEGILVGGNLSILLSLVGTDYLPDLRHCILYLEEIGEEPYRIDRMFVQLKMSGILDSVAGLILGSFLDCDPKNDVPSLTLDRIFADYTSNLNIPVITNFAHGHIRKKLTPPFGIKCRMNTSVNGIELLENPVA